jgi:hypothetical protein
MHKNHKNSIANRENTHIGSLYEHQFLQTGLQELFPGAVYLGAFKNDVIGSKVEHMFEYEGTVYVADCKGGTGLKRRDNCLDVLAEAAEFTEWKNQTSPDKPHNFIIITTNLPTSRQKVSVNRLQLARNKHGLHDIYVWNPDEANILEFFRG